MVVYVERGRVGHFSNAATGEAAGGGCRKGGSDILICGVVDMFLLV